jgi:hypothetical protein
MVILSFLFLLSVFSIVPTAWRGPTIKLTDTCLSTLSVHQQAYFMVLALIALGNYFYSLISMIYWIAVEFSLE